MPEAAQTKTRIFKNAGYFVITKRNPDGSLSNKPEDIYTSDAAIVESVTTSYSKTMEEMNDGNSFFPAASHATGVSATAEITLNTFDQKLWSFLTGAVKSKLTTGSYTATAEGYTIKEGGTVEIDASALEAGSIVLVRKANGEDYKRVEASPQEGEFTVNYETATLTFNTADVGKAVYVTCEKVSDTVTTYGVPAIPVNPSYQIKLVGENCDMSENDVIADNYIISNATAGDASTPVRQKSYGSWTATFNIAKPAPGENAIDWKNARKSVRAAE